MSRKIQGLNYGALLLGFAKSAVPFQLQADLGYKPRPQKINLINMNCKCIILGYKPRAIFSLEVYRQP